MTVVAEQRVAERFPVNAGTACGFAHPVVESPGPVKVRDVSMHGVGLIVQRRIEVGALLAVGLTNREKGFERTVLVRVAHVTPASGGFLVGGTFLTPLSYQDMTTLVL